MTKFLKKLVSEKNRIRNRTRAYIEYILIFTDWYKVIFPLNKLYAGRQLLMHMRSGMKIYIRDSRSKDLSAIREVLGKNDYHLENVPLRDTAVIFDIGANIGTFSMLAKNAYPTAKIVAVEPHPENFDLLLKNAPFATSRQAAVTDSTGTVRFQATGSPIGFRVLSDGALTVPSFSLDDLASEHDIIDLVKIDVEGSEYDILRGTSSKTFEKVGRLLIEAHATDTFTLEEGKKYLENLLTRASFEVTWVKYAVLSAVKTSSL